jgi:hypothetical protein
VTARHPRRLRQFTKILPKTYLPLLGIAPLCRADRIKLLRQHHGQNTRDPKDKEHPNRSPDHHLDRVPYPDQPGFPSQKPETGHQQVKDRQSVQEQAEGVIPQSSVQLAQGDGMEGSCQTSGDTGEADQHIREAQIGEPQRLHKPAGKQDASQNDRHYEVEQASTLRNLILARRIGPVFSPLRTTESKS